MIPDSTLRRIVSAIHGQSELYGCLIGFHGNNQSSVLHEGLIPAANYGRLMVIVEESATGQVEVSIQHRGASYLGGNEPPPHGDDS